MKTPLFRFLFRGYAEDQCPQSITIDLSELSKYQQFCRHLAGRSQSPYLIEYSLATPQTVIVYQCEWPTEKQTGPMLPAASAVTKRIIRLKKTSGLSLLNKRLLLQSVVLFSGLEHLQETEKSLRELRLIGQLARYLVLLAEGCGGENPVAEAIANRMAEALNIPSSFTSEERVGTKRFWCALSGREAATPKSNRPARSLALITVYNEVDMIEETLFHILDQGMDALTVDDCSTDGTDQVLERLSATKRVTWNKSPPEEATVYDIDAIMAQKERAALQAFAKGYQWVMSADADEIRCSPWPGVSLAEAFAHVEALGYNAVEFAVLDFRFLRDQQPDPDTYEKKMLYFEFGRRPSHFVQVKAWKQDPSVKVDLVTFVGHQVLFEGRRVFPLKFLLKHYPLRSREQAANKLYRDRFPRFKKENLARGFHTQYNHFKEKEPEGWLAEDLLPWDDSFYSRYMIERLSGVGLRSY